ncbi:carbon-nitrogen family hydrolase [soil metagenome]
MKTLLVQLDIAWENKAANHLKVTELLTVAQPEAGSLIVLPEMFNTGFSTRLEITAQSQGREDEMFLSNLAKAFQCTVMAGIISPLIQSKASNESVTFSPTGELLGRYVKMQPFTLGGEAECHFAGDEIITFHWQGFTVAPLVCYDLRFPEHFRTAVKKGANLIAVIASWPVNRYHHWLTLLQARAIENQAYVIGVNRCGSDPYLTYNGRSVVISPHGIIVADAGEGEGVVSASLDLEGLLRWRSEFPALADMKV